jgi:DNA-binding Lrp family transcriptional regulator
MHASRHTFFDELLNLDDLDFRIINELGGSRSSLWNVRESYSNIARKLGVDEETVRMRVSRARERGFLPDWRVMVNPLLINFREANLNLEVKDEARKDEAISKIKAVDGVYSIINFRGNEIVVLMYYEDSAASKVRQIESICGSQRLTLWDNPFPHPEVQMKKTDWRIIAAMQDDAWRDLDDVAKQLGLSTRTVQRRLSALKEGRAIYVHRPPNADAVTGLMCNFVVSFSDKTKKRAGDYAIHSTFNRMGASDTSHDQFSIFGISCENFAEADKVAEKLRGIDGVHSVRMRIIKEIIFTQEWLKNEIEKRISAP